MARVFISHAGADTPWAERVHLWLKGDGHDAFLDRDVDDGVLPGEEWEVRLYKELRQADAVVCIVTDSYLNSVWCAAEIGAARALGTELLPVSFSQTGQIHPLLKPIHFVDAARDESDARDKLRARLTAIAGGGGWGWPDDKSPYPGLRSFERGEHRVFFGRTREITRMAERLRSPDRAAPALLTVVGPSGCGKSSLVRAGVLPRIASEDYWLQIPPIVPGTDPLGALLRAIATATRGRKMEFGVSSLRSRLARDGLVGVATDLLIAAGSDSQCKLLIVIDQLEELLTLTEPAHRAQFVATLGPALGGPVQVLATLRPEFLDPLAKDPALSKLQRRIQEIRPLDAESLRSVIEEPAKVAGISFEEDLIARLVTDTGGGDALPLLAFTLEQLAHGVERGGVLTHQRYEAVGGVQGALERQADAAHAEACRKTAVTHDQVISELLDLVTIDDHGRPTKRRAVLDEFSGKVREELQPFIDRRLLSTEGEGDRTLVAVAHDAFLVNWEPLRAEIDAKAGALRARRVVESSANDWVAGGRDKSALLQGRQLTKTTLDIGADLKPPADGDGPSDRKTHRALSKWLPCHRQLVTRVDLNDVGREFLETSIRTYRARRRIRILEVVGVIVVLAGTTIFAGLELAIIREANARAHERLRESTALRLVSEGQAMLANVHEGGDARAIAQILTARKIAAKPDEGAILSALQSTVDQLKIIDAGTEIAQIAVSPDGRSIVSSESGGVVLRDIRSGLVTATLPALAVSADGTRAVAYSDDTLQVVDTQTRRSQGPVVALPKGGTLVRWVFSPDLRKVAFTRVPNFVYVWDIASGKVTSITSEADVSDIAFTADGARVVSSGYDGTVRFWDAQSGIQLSQPFSLQDTFISDIAVSADGRLIAGGRGNTVRVWDHKSGQLLGQSLPEPAGPLAFVISIAVSPDGDRIVSASTDDTIRQWDAKTAAPIGDPMVGHGDDVSAVAFSADGALIISGGSDKTIRVWDANPKNTMANFIGDEKNPPEHVAISADGRRIVSSSFKQIEVLDAETFEPVLPPLIGPTWDFALSRDGTRIVSLSADTVTVWDANTGARLTQWNSGQKFDPPFGWVALSPDGQKVATFGGTVDNPGLHQKTDMSIAVWDANSGASIVPPEHMTWVSSAVFSPDSQQLAYNKDQGVAIIDVTSGQRIRQFPFLQAMSVDYKADGRQILAAGDKTIRLLDPHSDQVQATMTDPRGQLFVAEFSKDGRYIISGSGDNIRVWDAETHAPIGDFKGGRTMVGDLGMSDDNQRIVATNLPGAGVWPGPAKWPDLLCNRLIHNMSDKQWNEWVEPDIPYELACQDLPKAG